MIYLMMMTLGKHKDESLKNWEFSEIYVLWKQSFYQWGFSEQAGPINPAASLPILAYPFNRSIFGISGDLQKRIDSW